MNDMMLHHFPVLFSMARFFFESLLLNLDDPRGWSPNWGELHDLRKSSTYTCTTAIQKKQLYTIDRVLPCFFRVQADVCIPTSPHQS